MRTFKRVKRVILPLCFNHIPSSEGLLDFIVTFIAVLQDLIFLHVKICTPTIFTSFVDDGAQLDLPLKSPLKS